MYDCYPLKSKYIMYRIDPTFAITLLSPVASTDLSDRQSYAIPNSAGENFLSVQVT